MGEIKISTKNVLFYIFTLYNVYSIIESDLCSVLINKILDSFIVESIICSFSFIGGDYLSAVVNFSSTLKKTRLSQDQRALVDRREQR